MPGRPPTDEAGLVTQIRTAVRRAYPSAWQLKTVGSPFQVSGLPDLLFCIDGLFVGMEVKFPHVGEGDEHARARATPQQRNQIRLINTAGGIAGCVVSVPEALDLIERGFAKLAINLREKEQANAGRHSRQ